MLLAIDTATSTVSVAIGDRGVPVGSGAMSIAGSGNWSAGTPALPPNSSLSFMIRF